MKQLFNNKSRFGAATAMTPFDSLVASIAREVNNQGSGFAKKEVGGAVFALESMDPTMQVEFDSTVKTLNTALESICREHKLIGNGKDGANIGSDQTVAQRQAAIVAGVMAGDVRGYINSPAVKGAPSLEGFGTFIPALGGDVMSDRKALEAYDEKENKNAVIYSVAYNMQAARQDEFGETFFPTVVVTPDQVGFTVTIRLIQVYDEIRRNTSGAIDQFKKRNIIQAVIDPSILRNDQTKIVPVVRPDSLAKFVAATLIPAREILHEGETINTAPLAMGQSLSLLGISQTEALLATGLQDSTDSIDTAAALAALYLDVKSGSDHNILKFNTGRLPGAVMTYAVQGNYRLMRLAFETSTLLINKDTKQIDGSAADLLATIGTDSLSVRLSVDVSGSINLETSETKFYSSVVSVARISDVDGNDIPLDGVQGAAIVALFANTTAVGYDLDARRTNLNRRQRGQLLDTTFYNQVYAVPLLSAITIPRPLTIGDANDSSDLAALITATHIRTSNAAVAELLRVKDILAEYVNSNDTMDNVPEILGVARFLVKPFYEHHALVVPAVIDSIKSHERADDIQATIVNLMRDVAYRMYTRSGYKAAADALAGGVAQVPTVIVGTDPILSRYLTVTGDFRTLGNDFNVKIVSTLNQDMAGKIVMTFGEFGAGKDGVPNPMHFGNMAWKPELTLILPLHRNGANSKELTVQPSFLHITNLPILAVIDVSGITDVVTAHTPIQFHPVP